MNSETPRPPREEIEARLTAMILGELPADQAFELGQAIAQDPELSKLYARLKLTTKLVSETESEIAAQTGQPALNLSEERRQKLLQHFKTVKPKEFSKPAQKRVPVLELAAALAILAILAALLLPTLAKSKARNTASANYDYDRSKGRKNPEAENLSQLDQRATQPRAMVSAGDENKPIEFRSQSAPGTIVLPSDGLRDTVRLAGVDPATGLPVSSAAPSAGGLVNQKERSLSTATVGATLTVGGQGGGGGGGGLPVQENQIVRTPALQTLGEPSRGFAAGNRTRETDLALNAQSPRGDNNDSKNRSFGGASPMGRSFHLELPPPVASPTAPAAGSKEELAGKDFSTLGAITSGVRVSTNFVPQLEPMKVETGTLAYDDLGRGIAQESLKTPEVSKPLAFGVGSLQGENKTGVGNQPPTSTDRYKLTDPPFVGVLEAVTNSVAVAANEPPSESGAFRRRYGLEVGAGAKPAYERPSGIVLPGVAAGGDALAKGSRAQDELAASAIDKADIPTVGKLLETKRLAELQVGPRFDAEPLGWKDNLHQKQGNDTKIARAQEDLDRLEKKSSPELADAPRPKLAATAGIPQPEVDTRENAFSTFSLNVSDVSFKLAAASLEQGAMPDPATVRSEEFINAFDYRDPEPAAGAPLAFAWNRAAYPFAQNRDLLRFSLKTAAQGRQSGKPLNIVLLLDNSGSMERADRVGIIHEALRVLASQMQPQDKLSVVSFARSARLLVDGVTGDQAGRVAEEVSQLTPQGGTNLEEAMNLAYQTALRHYVPTGINRVVLLTDGAANLGNVEPEALKKKVEAERKQGIALDCFGIGWEGYNDDLLEVLSRNGDGRYGFINTPEAAATDFAGQLAGALNVAASDVKVQVEFNPNRVTAYRQVGYAKHQLTKEQFRDNTVDAAEIAAAESGNALYVIQTNPRGEGPIATVRARYKVPGTGEFHEHEWAVPYTGNAPLMEQASPALKLAATASAFAEWLVGSPYAGEVTPDRLVGYLSGVPEVYAADGRPKKLEWMIRQAKSLGGK